MRGVAWMQDQRRQKRRDEHQGDHQPEAGSGEQLALGAFGARHDYRLTSGAARDQTFVRGDVALVKA